MQEDQATTSTPGSMASEASMQSLHARKFCAAQKADATRNQTPDLEKPNVKEKGTRSPQIPQADGCSSESDHTDEE